MQAASLLCKNLLLETDGSLQDLQILCLKWQTRPYCPSKSTVTLWSTDPNKSIMFLSTTMLNQTKWVRLNRKGWGILNPSLATTTPRPHHTTHPHSNSTKIITSLHWPFTYWPWQTLPSGLPIWARLLEGGWIWVWSIYVLCNGFEVSILCQSNYPHSQEQPSQAGKKGPYASWIIRSDVLCSFSALPSQLYQSAVQIHSTEAGKALHR